MQDVEEDDDDDDEESSGNFFNELFSLQVDNDKASWQKGQTVFNWLWIRKGFDLEQLCVLKVIHMKFDEIWLALNILS